MNMSAWVQIRVLKKTGWADAVLCTICGNYRFAHIAECPSGACVATRTLERGRREIEKRRAENVELMVAAGGTWQVAECDQCHALVSSAWLYTHRTYHCSARRT